MNVAIIDADLIARKRHRFPNLASMKISGWHKERGDSVQLLTDWGGHEYDRVYLSKVFTDTEVPKEIMSIPHLSYGGTGFFYDKAPKLPEEIEHHMPDYHLYDNWVEQQLNKGLPRVEFKYYLDYSIGFLTRGCFRQCEFCVNRNYRKAELHSPLDEFYDPERKKICMLDDNFLSHPHWKQLLLSLQETNKPFQFKQGLDERILTPEKCELLFSSKYDGDYIFAFDNIADYQLIEKKLKLIREYTTITPKFYLFCGFDRNDRWDRDFWIQDLYDLFERIKLLMKYHCLPYVMKFNRFEESPYRGTYINIGRWCNQPSLFKKKSYREFCNYVDSTHVKTKHTSACYKYMAQIENELPDLANKYYDMKFSQLSEL